MKRTSVLAAVTIAIALCAAVFLVPDAYAAVHLAAPNGDAWSLHTLLADAVPALAALRSQATDLRRKIDAKAAEIKDDTKPADRTRIEGEHAALVTELEGVNRKIADDEAAATRANSTSNAQSATATAHEAAAAAVRSERERVTEIRTMGAKLKLDAAFIEKHAGGPTTVDEFRRHALDELVTKQSQQGGPSGGSQNRGLENGQDETETRREAMVEYIRANYNAPGAKMTDRARGMYRGMKAVDLVREVLAWGGVATRGLTHDEIVQRGLMATSDFPNILANTASKTLRAAYEAAPRTFIPWTRDIQLPDFKSYNILRRGETPQLALLNEHGEFKRGSVKESKETVQLKTYGITVGLTRQLIVNDDLGAMVSIPSDFGQSAATLESDVVYWLLLNNPALNQDSVAVFNSAHNNLAASGTALDITPMSTMRAKMAKQTGVDGKTVLNLLATYVLVPPELISRAEQLLASFAAAKNTDVVPEGLKNLKPISEARLSVGVTNTDAGLAAQAGSATAYYLASTQVDTIVTAHLQGQDGPYVESRVGFGVDGVEIKCRHDFAASATDYRGLQKDPGA